MNFACTALNWGRHWLHPVYYWMNCHAEVTSRDLKVPTTGKLFATLKHWEVIDPIQEALPLRLMTHPLTLMTDASSTGFGAAWEREVLSGIWSQTAKEPQMGVGSLFAH
ncbi:unnamed protein product [Rotaria magnacalcarata]|uniref:Uncharacterized protein n=1 Tax=Rotaria magnacalcarata TaxID=392030 RepID=A0A820G8B1_9BILA|nr:unnamed protein product [Rotaria magnacalcarata]CAF4275960.1 unnamed protein product [Rotaria magnacalcarata]